MRAGAARGPSAAAGGSAAAAARAACNLGQLFRSELFLWIAHDGFSLILCVVIVLGLGLAAVYFEVELE
jgi:hypothetical protein